MKDGRKNKTFKAVCSQNMKSMWSNMSPEERAARSEKMKIARETARAARKAAKQEVAVVHEEQLELPLVQQEYTPSIYAVEEAMTALDILVQVTSSVLGVTLNRQQAAEFWANRLK
jgi:predicted nuclease with TOPRIM domain